MDSEGKKVELIHFECWKPSLLGMDHFIFEGGVGQLPKKIPA